MNAALLRFLESAVPTNQSGVFLLYILAPASELGKTPRPNSHENTMNPAPPLVPGTKNCGLAIWSLVLGLLGYIKGGVMPTCPAGGLYILAPTVGTTPGVTCPNAQSTPPHLLQ